ncbi:thiamine pyrophosphate-dependent dehydrogenase E1 component subunit alpha [Arthrobacter agilis]|uniref:thiamine pyrophosphate-dependent dehydrogenase E1 component subunit alpha n=1 Tax=Arthrobacter agilis TaxID=37921 RepID=UPI000B359BF7|nr:thiamine pyrophosphate-dependent dehydrogenase E1 component subunit alpha [Arthrobacter agilis]OUM42164.1 pyruvate dehydrogenase (acetyl-transferring) E1 component subunit alpha [Arthrobacter agilis]PPB45509.1 thiamine pyrophosphate-dependent dehydrogenase E1 component subunit alpha [Arthrobacter agilis]TPV26515.1 thiamine pyrophosphate-dependent dehydrogenase E1 component subunit alpha [Arthrobacter agilis]VDR33573.1 Pyruvate dehydrogenase E1 component subunit alpha [Arthrobacter agilis]
MSGSRLPAAEFEVEDVVRTAQAAHQDGFSQQEPEGGMLQVLRPDGSMAGGLTAEIGGAPVDFSPYLSSDPAHLRSLYRDMYLIRRFDQESTALQRQGQLALWVPLAGQEGAQIGSGRAMAPQDYAFPTYREHGVALTRGVALADILRLFRGVTNGGWDPREHNFHLYTLVLAAQSLHAVGYAMGMQRDQLADPALDPGASIAYFGDGASSEGDVHESMVFAASFDAPVVFFCQNNQWAISVPATVQTRVPLAKRAEGYGFPGVRVDGNDVVAVEAVTRWALDHARSGRGPVLIEAYTYRMSAHTTADDPTKYRLTGEEQDWQPRDPLVRLEAHLRSAGGADEAFFDDLAAEAKVMATGLRDAVLTMTAPDLESRFAAVYAEPHALVQEELGFFRQYEAGFADEGKNA